MKSADLLVDARGAEIQHRSGLTAPDVFIYLAPDKGKPTVFFDAREYDVQRKKLARLKNGVRIRRLEPYVAKVSKKSSGDPLANVLLVILKRLGITSVRVSPTLPYALGQALEQAGLKVEIYNFARERERKSGPEIQQMIAAQRVTESAFELAWQILSDSHIRANRIIFQGEVLTSERMKIELKRHLLVRGYACPDGIIVASGEQTARPHDEGSGPLLPNTSIIIDIFPRSEETGYVADMTRTFVKGKPKKQIQRLYAAVEKVQREVIKKISVGDRCADIHQLSVQGFTRLGYETSHKKGFMHGTGHSLGLNVHEGPSLSARSKRAIEKGMVFTVEPGLYYPGIGGVRLEDVVIFHSSGRKENITQFDRPYVVD